MTAPYNLLDTKAGDRVLGQAEVQSLANGSAKAVAAAGAATLNALAGIITSEDLTTAAGADYVLTLADTQIAATDFVTAQAQLGTSTDGLPQVVGVAVSANQAVITVRNQDAADAFNGNIKIAFQVNKQS